MLLARHSLYAAAAVSAVTALPAVASASAANTARDAPPVCLDATNERADNTRVRLWQCMDHANQRFVFDGSQIKVKDTIGTSREVCLDATNERADNTRVRLWQCMDHANQRFVFDGSQIALGIQGIISADLRTCLRGDREAIP